MEADNSLSMLCLGDSYTIGEGVAASERWPVQLQSMLSSRGITLSAPQIIAQTGWSTDELSAAIKLQHPESCFAAVSLLIGVNDQYRGRSAESFRIAFADLLVSAIMFARAEPARVLVLAIPDWGVTPFAARDKRGAQAIRKQIDEFNSHVARIALGAQCRFVDVCKISRARDPGMLTADELHPSAQQYQRWARAVLEVFPHA